MREDKTCSAKKAKEILELNECTFKPTINVKKNKIHNGYNEH